MSCNFKNIKQLDLAPQAVGLSINRGNRKRNRKVAYQHDFGSKFGAILSMVVWLPILGYLYTEVTTMYSGQSDRVIIKDIINDENYHDTLVMTKNVENKFIPFWLIEIIIGQKDAFWNDVGQHIVRDDSETKSI